MEKTKVIENTASGIVATGIAATMQHSGNTYYDYSGGTLKEVSPDFLDSLASIDWGTSLLVGSVVAGIGFLYDSLKEETKFRDMVSSQENEKSSKILR